MQPHNHFIHMLHNGDSSMGTWNGLTPDSAYSGNDTIVQSKVNSFFSSGRFVPGELSPNEVKPVSNDWIILHLVVTLIVLAWIRVFFEKRLKQVFKSFISTRHFNMLIRDGNLFSERIAIVSTIVYLITFSLLIYQLIAFQTDSGAIFLSGYKLFAFIIMMVLGAFILKNLAVTFIGNIFKNKLLLTDFLLMNFIFNINMGVWLFPLVVLAIFLPSGYVLYMALILWFLGFIYKLIRQFMAGLGRPNFSALNIFLYLCTLEIAPILVLIKLFYSELGFEWPI